MRGHMMDAGSERLEKDLLAQVEFLDEIREIEK
jgi:hypothetical protein